jgi:hypothetical protein
MVDSARINALLTEGDTVSRQLREMIIAYECVLPQYGLPSFDLVPAEKNSFLREGGSRPNTTPQKEAVIERVRYPKPFWIRGEGRVYADSGDRLFPGTGIRGDLTEGVRVDQSDD